MNDQSIPPEEQELEDDEIIEGEDEAPEEQPDEQSDESDDTAEEPAKLQKRLKDTQRAFTKKSQEAAELRKKLDEMEQLKGEIKAIKEMSVQKQEPQKEKSPFEFLDEEETASTLLDDPKNIISLQKKTLSGLAEILERRDKAMLSEIKKQLGNVVSDEGRALAKKVSELRKDNDYSAFTDEQLAVIAKKTIKPAPSKDTYRGGMGGKSSARGTLKDDDESSAKEIFKTLYPDDKWED